MNYKSFSTVLSKNCEREKNYLSNFELSIDDKLWCLIVDHFNKKFYCLLLDNFAIEKRSVSQHLRVCDTLNGTPKNSYVYLRSPKLQECIYS